jgi:hypothetical protein
MTKLSTRVKGWRFLHVKVSGETTDLGVHPDELPLEQLQALVGGPIEYIPRVFHTMEGSWQAIANEDGHPLNLPVNIKAMTMIGWTAPIPLVGDVVLYRPIREMPDGNR